MKKNLLSFTIFLSVLTFGQVGINTKDPKVTLDISKSTNITLPDGLLYPKLTADELEAKKDTYTEDQHGTFVYITSDNPGTGVTSEVNGEGLYYYNANIQKFVSIKSLQPWFSQSTNVGATTNSENIYHTGQVSIGSNSSDPSAQFQISSTNRGVLLPRMTTEDRNKINSPANGLMIYNTSTNCLNYYDTTIVRWLSLCGDIGPATFELIDCSAPTGPQGTYMAGKNISGNSTNTYTLKLSVSEVGNYSILLNTGNGYSFSKTGTFNQTGNYTITLEGQGTPINAGEDTPSLVLNGIPYTPSCTLPTITVDPSGATIDALNCNAISTFGTYITNQALSASSHYVDVPITIYGAGDIVVETLSENGIRFSSGSINVNSSTTSIRLYGSGTPSKTGTSTFKIEGFNCTFDIIVGSDKGTFKNPVNRCTEILDEVPNATDRYYWVKDANNNKFKTYCDMTNGGWTLVKSLSEKQILVRERTQAESMASQGARNVVNTENGKFNEYAFSLPAATVNNIGARVGNREIRFTIKEKGHTTGTTATANEIESTTIRTIDDEWLMNNYQDHLITSTLNPSTGNFSGNGYTSSGKLFGFSFGKPVTGDTRYQIDGVNFNVNLPGLYSQANFFTGIYGAIGYASNSNTYLTYTSSNGGNATFDKYHINDLFGLYMNSEAQLNHHIGTCSNSTDDYGGASNCAAGWNNWRPHNFNDGEGRILQHWVK